MVRRLPKKIVVTDEFIRLTGVIMRELATAVRAQIEWITERDAKVCDICDENEDESPYAPNDVPPFPGHPRCRCSLLPIL